jgi:L-2-hydroxyglutarate oxidase LhgO
MRALRADAEEAGAAVALRSPVRRGRRSAGGIELEVGGQEPASFLAARVFNAAGLGAQAVANAIEGIRPGAVPPRRLAKGSYYALSGAAPFSRLVYPIPVHGGLGVHLTLDLGGQARFGPDVEWVEGEDYRVEPGRADAFYAEVRRYWPGLPDGALQPAYAGIRPKLHGPGEPRPDFVIDDTTQPSVIALFGIESPGLTGSLAIGEHVAGLARL